MENKKLSKMGALLYLLSAIVLVGGGLAALIYSIILFVAENWAGGLVVLCSGGFVVWLEYYVISCFAELFDEVNILSKKISILEDRLEPKKKKEKIVKVVSEVKEGETVQAEALSEVVNNNNNKNIEVVDIVTFAKRTIRHLDAYEQNLLKEKNLELCKEISNFTNEELEDKIKNSEEYGCSRTYLYLYCIELLFRKAK